MRIIRIVAPEVEAGERVALDKRGRLTTVERREVGRALADGSRAFVQVAEDDDVFACTDESIGDRLDGSGLPKALVTATT